MPERQKKSNTAAAASLSSEQEKDYVQELTLIMARLRSETGCPWDRQQTHRSLKEFLAEEAAELFDAIDQNDDENILEELGDVLLQVIFHCQIAREEERFDLQDAARQICQKLIRRHPHVFAGSKLENAEQVVSQWEQIKLTEKNPVAQSKLDGVPRSLPALHRAHKIQGKAAKLGFDWPNMEGVVEKIEEELGELRQALKDQDDNAIAEEIGDLLFSIVNLSRYRNHLAEDLLHSTVEKFYNRFNKIETKLAGRGKTPEECSLRELDALWDQAKKETDQAGND